jgi:hypothetical protein
MARGKGKNNGNPHPKKRPIDRYEHKHKKRINTPPVGLVTPETDPPLPTHKVYDYVQPVPDVKPGKELQYDPHLDPQLVWAGKKEHVSFEVPTVSLHVHETIDPRTIIEAVRKRNGEITRPSAECSCAPGDANQSLPATSIIVLASVPRFRSSLAARKISRARFSWQKDTAHRPTTKEV